MLLKASGNYNFLYKGDTKEQRVNETSKVIGEYVLSRKSLLKMRTMPEYLIDQCSFLSGLNLLSGDKISYSLYKDKVKVSVETQGLPFWGNCRSVSDEFDIADLTDYFSVFDEVEKLNIERVDMYKSGYDYSDNKLYISNRKRVLVVGEEVLYSKEDLEDEWNGFRSVLEMVGRTRVPYSLSSCVVNAIFDSVNKILGKEINLSLEEVVLKLRCEKGMVEAEITVGTSKDCITIDFSKNFMISEGWFMLFNKIAFLFTEGLVLSVKVGGNAWSRNNCLIFSNALQRGENLVMIIKG